MDFTALRALPHAFQHVISGSFRQIQIDDGEVRTIELIGVNRLDKRDGARLDNVRHLAFALFERFADQSRISGIMLDDKDRNSLLIRSPIASVRAKALYWDTPDPYYYVRVQEAGAQQ